MCDVTNLFSEWSDSIIRQARYHTSGYVAFKQMQKSAQQMAEDNRAVMSAAMEQFMVHGDDIVWVAVEEPVRSDAWLMVSAAIRGNEPSFGSKIVHVGGKNYHVPWIKQGLYSFPNMDDVAVDDLDTQQDLILERCSKFYRFYGFPDKASAMLFKLENGGAA